MKNLLQRPLLTLAIPTYNRLDCLRLLIESVINQIPSEGILGETFELLISNNASTDGTTEYLNGLINIPGISVIQQPINCGPVDNVIQCYEAAKGQFVWIMGDDDVPLVGAVLAVMECLERDQPDLLYLPARWVAGDLSERAKNKIGSKAIMTLDSMGLAVRSNIFVTFISSWIMNKDAYLRRVDAKIDRYRDTNFPHLEWIFFLLVEGKKIMCSNENWIIARAGNSGGYSVFETFTIEYNRIVDEELADKPQLHHFFRRCMLWCYIPSLIWGVRNNAIGSFGEFDKEKTINSLKLAYGNDLFFLLFIIPIVRFNVPVAWVFKTATRVFGKSWLLWRLKSVPITN